LPAPAVPRRTSSATCMRSVSASPKMAHSHVHDAYIHYTNPKKQVHNQRSLIPMNDCGSGLRLARVHQRFNIASSRLARLAYLLQALLRLRVCPNSKNRRINISAISSNIHRTGVSTTWAVSCLSVQPKKSWLSTADQMERYTRVTPR
jgi:hypothetical protein